jgi:hypothetical protein
MFLFVCLFVNVKSLLVLKLGHFGKQARNTLEVLKCGT